MLKLKVWLISCTAASALASYPWTLLRTCVRERKILLLLEKIKTFWISFYLHCFIYLVCLPDVNWYVGFDQYFRLDLWHTICSWSFFQIVFLRWQHRIVHESLHYNLVFNYAVSVMSKLYLLSLAKTHPMLWIQPSSFPHGLGLLSDILLWNCQLRACNNVIHSGFQWRGRKAVCFFPSDDSIRILRRSIFETLHKGELPCLLPNPRSLLMFLMTGAETVNFQ